MQIIYYTVAGIVLYLAADWILRQLERRRGSAFENRTLIFFFILLALAVATFQAIRYFLATPALPG
ncbi:MAG TPA: hypothetical protein VGA88_09470 [Burkholderiales bacterium]